MKKQLTLLLLLLISISYSSGQNKEIRNVSTFTKISFRVPGKLVLRQGSPQKVEIEGDRETISKIETEVKGDRLVIGNEDRWNWGWQDNDRVMVYITVKDISGVVVSGSGDLVTEGKVTTDKLELSVSGSGSLQIETSVSGDMEADISGSGRIEVKGSCRSFDSDISGSGKVNATLTVADQVEVSISGSGKVSCWYATNAYPSMVLVEWGMAINNYANYESPYVLACKLADKFELTQKLFKQSIGG